MLWHFTNLWMTPTSFLVLRTEEMTVLISDELMTLTSLPERPPYPY